MDLTLAVKAKYFHEIQNGSKKWEFRLQTEYWKKRLVGRKYDRVIITLGYPKSDDTSRRMSFPWRGIHNLNEFTHEHFGSKPVAVYAIRLGEQNDK